jgi:hypothetical protein
MASFWPFGEISFSKFGWITGQGAETLLLNQDEIDQQWARSARESPFKNTATCRVIQ